MAAIASASAAPASARRRASRRPRRGIRWDRVGRVALLAVIGAIALLYISPAKHWWEQSRTAAHQRDELRELERQNRQLEAGVRALQRPDALEREARRLGMVRRGEQAFVITNQPPR